jgi:hypothetical protein
LYSLIKSNIPRLPVSISSVSSWRSKPGASDLRSTSLLVIGLNCSIISNAPAEHLVLHKFFELLEKLLLILIL